MSDQGEKMKVTDSVSILSDFSCIHLIDDLVAKEIQ